MWCFILKKDILLNNIKDVLSDDRRLDIFRLRSSGATLQEIGNKYDITRERVRQIIYVPSKRIIKIIQDNDNFVIKEITTNNVVDNNKAISFFTQDLWPIVRYVLIELSNNKNNNGWGYICENDILFYRYEDVIKFFKDVDISERIIDSKAINDFTSKVIGLGLNVWNKEDTIRFFEQHSFTYSHDGDILFPSNISMRDAILYITSRPEYKNGVSIRKENKDIENLNSIITNCFNIESESLNALSSRVSSLLYIWGKKVYINGNLIRYDRVVKDKIVEFLKEHSGKQVLYRKLFSSIEKDIDGHTNAKNEDQLHGLILYMIEKENLDVVAKKYYVSYNQDGLKKSRDHFFAIYEFLLKKGKPVTIEEIKKSLPLVSQKSVDSSKMYYPQIVSYNSGYFMNTDAIKYTNGEKDIIKDILKNKSYGFLDYVNVHEVFQEACSLHPNVVKKTMADNPRSFGVAIRSIAAEAGYSYKFPHFVRGLNGDISKKSIAIEYIKRNNNNVKKEDFMDLILALSNHDEASAKFLFNSFASNEIICVNNDSISIIGGK